MDYKKMIEEAKSQGKGTALTVKRLVLKPGDTLEGLFLGRELVASKKKGFPDSYSYKWEVASGGVTCFMSSAFDKDVGARLETGNLYQVTFVGKRALSEGRSLKEFEVIDYGAVVEDTDEGEGED